jgi:hypothetical protein
MPTTCEPQSVTSEDRTYVRNVHAPHAEGDSYGRSSANGVLHASSRMRNWWPVS